MRATFGVTLLACLSVALGFEQIGVQRPYTNSQSVVAGNTGRRHTRGVDCSSLPGNPEDMLKCCTFSSESGFDTASAIPPPPGNGFDVEQFICDAEQAFKSERLVKDNGKVDFEECRKTAVVDMNNEKWNAPIDTSFTNCSPTLIEEMVANGKHNCTSGSLELGICVFRELYLNCPADCWKSDDEMCTKSKTYVQDCPKGYHT